MRKLILVLAIVLLTASFSWGADLTLAWNANTEPDLAGYNVYWDTVNPPAANVQDVGNVTQYTITGLSVDQIYFMSVTAYDNETPSNESILANGTIIQYVPRTGKLIIILDAPQGVTTQ